MISLNIVLIVDIYEKLNAKFVFCISTWQFHGQTKIWKTCTTNEKWPFFSNGTWKDLAITWSNYTICAISPSPCIKLTSIGTGKKNNT